jgi:hypothetical protein
MGCRLKSDIYSSEAWGSGRPTNGPDFAGYPGRTLRGNIDGTSRGGQYTSSTALYVLSEGTNLLGARAANDRPQHKGRSSPRGIHSLPVHVLSSTTGLGSSCSIPTAPSMLWHSG